MPPGRKSPPPFPSKQDLIDFIEGSPNRVGKKEMMRAFQVAPKDRAAFRTLIKEVTDDGILEHRASRRGGRGALPPVAVVEVVSVDDDGVLWARPATGREAQQPQVYFPPRRGRAQTLAVGDKVLARLARRDDGYAADIIRKLVSGPRRLLGVYVNFQDSGRLLPIAKSNRFDLLVAAHDRNGAQNGELVEAEMLPGRQLGLRTARVLSRLGAVSSPEATSLIAIHEHEIPFDFSEQALAEAAAAKPVALGKRTDLRSLPLVTIDGDDARDFDDAVWAEADRSADNSGGWRIVVAIADVAQYVRPASDLDNSARERGNSVYFPDRAVHMLPEALASGLCSLLPDESRPVLVADMRITRAGELIEHKFQRALMKSAARLTYRQIQDAFEGRSDDVTAPLLEAVIKPLYAAYNALQLANLARGPLALELPEMRILLSESGHVDAVRPRQVLASHKLIEAMMVLANVAAAETLERLSQPCMYRIHDRPEAERLRNLKKFLSGLGLNLSLGEVVRPALFNRILAKVKGGGEAEAVNQAILRSQAQATYSPDNIGHFGLALARYAHFTSPIRRYSDLLVHRALIHGLKLGAGGLSDDEAMRFAEIAKHLSMTERRAMLAERDSVDRYIAAYLSEQVGGRFSGVIAGVSKAGLFVRLDDTHADGLVPMSSLPGERYDLDPSGHMLTGRRSRRRFTLGDACHVTLEDANRLTGGLILNLADARNRQSGASTGVGKRGSKRSKKRRRSN